MSAPLGHLSKNVCSEILREAYSQYLKIYKSSSMKFVANEIENNVWCIKFRSKHSTVLLLSLLRNLMHQMLFSI